MKHERVVFLDWLRIIACFMVMAIHSAEPFYLGGEAPDITHIASRWDMLWITVTECLCRVCVPLFVITSSYLLFPVNRPTGEFSRRRLMRVVVPFAVWAGAYVWAAGGDWGRLFFNFPDEGGHLWFVPMLLGLYLLMPLLSPWAEKVSKKELQFYLGIWFLTTLLPLVRDWAAGGELAVTYGPFGLPRQALYPLWGEASWNGYGVFYYLSGMVGYLLLGLYFRRFVGKLSWGKTLAIALPAYLAGFAISFGGFLRRVLASGEVFPKSGTIDLAVSWETTWCNDTVGVALMTIAWLLLFRKITADGRFYQRVLLPVSKASYGMYLCHLLVLVPVSAYFRPLCPTPVAILVTAVVSFVVVAAFSVLVQRIPKAGKWIIG